MRRKNLKRRATDVAVLLFFVGAIVLAGLLGAMRRDAWWDEHPPSYTSTTTVDVSTGTTSE